jgi:hypothetical protein
VVLSCVYADAAVQCKLTMEPFRDPVVTPAGFTYERAALFQHFAKLGHFDPVSRAKVQPPEAPPSLVPTRSARLSPRGGQGSRR